MADLDAVALAPTGVGTDPESPEAQAWPSTEDETDDDAFLPSLADWHVVLLRLAGALPDDLLTEARGWLADGHAVDVAQALAFAATANRIPVLDLEAGMIAAELGAGGQDAGVVAELTRLDPEVVLPTPWRFSPVPPKDHDETPALLDLTSEPAGTPNTDPLDQVAIAATRAETQHGVSGLWRAWRSPADGSPWPPHRRVYVVGTAPDFPDADALPGVAVRIQDALADAGEDDPQVEVCPGDFEAPDYHNQACGHGALLWTSEPVPPIRLARVFDVVDPLTGPGFDPGHARLADDEAAPVLEYLANGLPLLTTTATMADVLDPAAGDVVPLSFRTDGVWIWTDTVTWYLQRHGLAPELDLLAHVRTQLIENPSLSDELGFGAMMVSDAALHRALAFLQLPDDEEPVWTVPGMGGAESGPDAV